MNPHRNILRRNWKIILGTTLLSIISSFSMVFAGFSLSFFFTAYEQGENQIKALILTFLIELLIWLTAMGVYHLSLLAKCHAKKVIRHDLRLLVVGKISSLSYLEYQDKDCGNLVSWLTNDVEQIYTQAFAPIFSGTEALASWIFSLLALFLLSPYIGITAIILLGVVSVLPQLAVKRLQKANTERSAAMEAAVEQYKDTVMGASIFLLSNLHSQFAKRIADTSQQAEQKDCTFNKTNISVQIMISTFSMVGQVILLFVSFLAASIGAAVPGAVLSVANLSGSFFNGVGDFTQAITQVKASRTLWSKFTEVEADPSEKQNVPSPTDIRLDGISFRYEQAPVLENVDYDFQAGGKYAIVGESGSGKSTLVKILLGLLPNYSGNVFYNTLEQKNTSLPSLYDQIAYVDQQVYLFQDTLRYNVTLGQPYSDPEIQEVLKKCCLTAFADSLPQGIDTVISENGKNLSGGQRQRIALARSLIRHVQWIILDEGTSALDETNALEIETNLIAQRNLGVILITHNLRKPIESMLTGIYLVPKQ